MNPHIQKNCCNWLKYDYYIDLCSYMQGEELCSIGFIQTETSLVNFLQQSKGEGRRFKRSRSGQRSRSKENCFNNDNPSFFVKNIFPNLQSTSTIDKTDATPQRMKRKNNHIRNRDTDSSQKHNEPASLIKHCDELNQLLDKSNSYILELENRIAQLEEELKDRPAEAAKMERGKESKGSNLAKLRKQIAETRVVEAIPSEVLQQQVRMLQAENLCLREEVQALKSTIREQEESANNARSKRQSELQALIQQLRGSLLASEKRQGQLKMEIGRLRLRQSKLTDNQQQARSEQLTYLRFRYEKMRKKFEENRKALQALQRRQEASSYLFPQEEREVSFSLSP